jgi:uncharacterized membrane protein YczE
MRLGLGLVLCGVSIALMLTAGFGVDYWDVLHQGLSQRTGIEIAVLAFGGPVGVGTVVYAVSIGALSQYFIARLSVQESESDRQEARRASTANWHAL